MDRAMMDRLQPVHKKHRDVHLQSGERKIQLAFMGNASVELENTIRSVPKSERSGFFTPAVVCAYKSSFTDIWSGNYAWQDMQERQGSLLIGLVSDNSELFDHGAELRLMFQMQLISDMASLLPQQGCDHPDQSACWPERVAKDTKAAAAEVFLVCFC